MLSEKFNLLSCFILVAFIALAAAYYLLMPIELLERSTTYSEAED